LEINSYNVGGSGFINQWIANESAGEYRLTQATADDLTDLLTIESSRVNSGSNLPDSVINPLCIGYLSINHSDLIVLFEFRGYRIVKSNSLSNTVFNSTLDLGASEYSSPLPLHCRLENTFYFVLWPKTLISEDSRYNEACLYGIDGQSLLEGDSQLTAFDKSLGEWLIAENLSPLKLIAFNSSCYLLSRERGIRGRDYLNGINIYLHRIYRSTEDLNRELVATWEKVITDKRIDYIQSSIWIAEDEDEVIVCVPNCSILLRTHNGVSDVVDISSALSSDTIPFMDIDGNVKSADFRNKRIKDIQLP
jgi:hypothetical protein